MLFYFHPDGSFLLIVLLFIIIVSLGFLTLVFVLVYPAFKKKPEIENDMEDENSSNSN